MPEAINTSCPALLCSQTPKKLSIYLEGLLDPLYYQLSPCVFHFPFLKSRVLGWGEKWGGVLG